MTKTNDFIFKALMIVAWIIFVALCIEAGALVVNFIFSIFNPSTVGDLYQKLDLSRLYQQSQMVFYGMFGFVLFIALLKAYLFYVVISLLHKFDLTKPFSSFVSKQIFQISYITFSIGIFSYIARQTTKYLSIQGYALQDLNQFWVDSQTHIVMAAIIYIIAVIFKKGIELQNENDLTV
jgi:hypothetical protein